MRKGSHHTDEARAKISEANKGRSLWPQSASHRYMIGAGKRGKIVSDESRKKMSIAHLKRNAKQITA